MNILMVFMGGGLGCLLRYAIGSVFQRTALTLPWSTFVSNVVACLVFALTIWFGATKEALPFNLRLLLLTGFCGGLSTFSSFGFETFLLLKQGMFLYAGLNILFNTVCCILIFYIFRYP